MNTDWRAVMLGRGAVGRSQYLGWGVGLVVLKLTLDRWIWYGRGRAGWSLGDPEFWSAYLWQVLPRDLNDRTAMFLLGLTAVPFLAVGLMLTLARLRSAGLRPWWAVLFFVPAVKLVFFGLLCVLPAAPPEGTPPKLAPDENGWNRWRPKSRFGAAASAVGITGALSLPLIWLGTTVLADYGWSLFLGAPFCLGFVSALIYGAGEERDAKECCGVALLAMTLVGALMVAVAWEGVICLLMAAPLGLLIGCFGALVACAVLPGVRRRSQTGAPGLACCVLLLTPLSMWNEHAARLAPPRFEVRTSVDVEAPPEVVWRHVVTFEGLPPPHEWLFRLGIAYPVRAVIAGRGVGAIRRCEFSTGPFVEPIDVWDEPNLLKFRVTENPEPMQEWTPYHSIHPAHLDGYLESEGGQFRLTRLPGGRTRLEGTTWYHHRLWPGAYWRVWSDAIIHTIHRRVLNQVKLLAETQG